MKRKQVHIQGGASKSLSAEVIEAIQRARSGSLKDALAEYVPLYKQRIKYETDVKKLKVMRVKYEELKRLLETLNS